MILTSVDLPGAVVAHQADDLALVQRERHVDQRLDGAEVLGDVGELEDGHFATFRRMKVVRLKPDPQARCRLIAKE
jgi:hypothetical protein